MMEFLTIDAPGWMCLIFMLINLWMMFRTYPMDAIGGPRGDDAAFRYHTLLFWISFVGAMILVRLP